MIEFHADDYGLTVEQSKRIIDCIDNGAINAVSIMPNSPYLDECMKMLGDRKVLKTVHLNLINGHTLTDAPHISTNGVYGVSFAKLLLISYTPGLRSIYRKEIAAEYAAQIRATAAYTNNGRYRLDSHWHFHMLPVAFDAMMDAVKETGIDVEYIRLPADKISFFLKPGKKEKVRPINIVKVLILNFLRARNKLVYGSYLSKLEQKDFFGVLYSGHMNEVNTGYILKNLDKNKSYELLFHPGSVIEQDGIDELTNIGDKTFLTSSGRSDEAAATRAFSSYKKQ